MSSPPAPLAAFEAYIQDAWQALRTVNARDLDAMAQAMGALAQSGRTLFTCGNGGSAANASHFAQDLSNLSLKAGHRMMVVSLSSGSSMLTATANDFGYDAVFSRQLEIYAQPGDALLAISGSGNSPNVLRATEWANAHGLTTLALVGFDGGRLKSSAQLCAHVPSTDMGMLEGIHLLCLDYLAKRVTARRG